MPNRYPNPDYHPNQDAPPSNKNAHRDGYAHGQLDAYSHGYRYKGSDIDAYLDAYCHAYRNANENFNTYIITNTNPVL